ncbi:MAG: bifunctional folylpolyglutamate synthase/dihydrofolate synthase [Solirubrobacteraceae bacterium]
MSWSPIGPPWSPADAQGHLRSLELFGMRFGLERMRRMMVALGSPQAGMPAIHVLGTNGKSSTTRMIAAILSRHGLRTGAYLSPHLTSYTQRIQVCEQDVAEEDFAGAVQRAAWAAERVNHTLADDDRVTQFELLTAAALWELARREVDVAVVEAGLGGRYDATSVIDAGVCVLSNVGLEHTRWLGPSVADIAAEKLAALGDGATLVVGPALHHDALALARRAAREGGGRFLQAPMPDAATPTAPGARAPHAVAAGVVTPVTRQPAFQQRNFALARMAAESHLAELGIAVREDAIGELTGELAVPGRFELVGEDPTMIFDGAHNPDAAVALAESMRDGFPGRPVALVLGVLEDKDAVGMLRALLALCERAWFTAPPGPRALPPATLQSLAHQLGFERTSCEPQPARALAAARAWALSEGSTAGAPGRADALVLATGSIYLIGELMEATGLADRAGSAVAEHRTGGPARR